MTTALLVRIGRTSHAIDVGLVDEVARLPAWSTLPGHRPHVLGLVDVHGSSVPLLDVEGFLTGQARGRRDGDLVVLGRERPRLGLVVDAVVGLAEVHRAGEEVDGSVRDDDGALHVVLEPATLFSAAGLAPPRPAAPSAPADPQDATVGGTR